MNKIFQLAFIILMGVGLIGCASPGQQSLISKLRYENDLLRTEAQQLEDSIYALENDNDYLRNALESRDGVYQDLVDANNHLKYQLQQKEQERDNLLEAQNELARRLKGEISDYKAKLEMTEKGLVVSFLAEILFDSGKAEIKPRAYQILDKVARTLNSPGIRNSEIAIEGHTDNVPIRYSSWKSNWELASQRALSVLDYFEKKAGVDSLRLSAISYGEFSPRESNATEQGRSQNRRVEIVIFPDLQKKTFN